MPTYSARNIMLRGVLYSIIHQIEMSEEKAENPTNFIIAHVANKAKQHYISPTVFFKSVKKLRSQIQPINVIDPIAPTSRQLEFLSISEALEMYRQLINNIQAYIIKHPEEKFLLSDHTYTQYAIIFHWFTHYSQKLKTKLDTLTIEKNSLPVENLL